MTNTNTGTRHGAADVQADDQAADDTEPDPRVTFGEWFEASPFDDIAELLRSSEFLDAAEMHHGDEPGGFVLADLENGAYEAVEDDVSRLTDAGFEAAPVYEGTMRVSVGDGEAAIVVPEGDEPPWLAWSEPEPERRPNARIVDPSGEQETPNDGQSEEQA